MIRRGFASVLFLSSSCKGPTAASPATDVLDNSPSWEGNGNSGCQLKAETNCGAGHLPLPCPPTDDPAPAKGCMGRGLTGPQRKKRALDIWYKTLEEAPNLDLTRLFDVYVLMPADPRGLEYLRRMDRQPRVDCFLGGQIQSAQTSDPPAKWPHFYPSDATCEYQPPFLTCFPGFFEPSPGIRSCWRPAEP